jgi:hypothetical protein
MKDKKHEQKDPCMISRQGAASPKDLQQPMMFNPPGGQTGSPSVRPLDLDFHLGKDGSQNRKPDSQPY